MLRIEGYASRWGELDLNNDIVEPRAFYWSSPQMLYQHEAKKPIGVWHDIIQDDVGLFVRGVTDHPMVTAKIIDGLSIGFRTVSASHKDGVRHLIKVRLWEISIVTFPMLPTARITRYEDHVPTTALRHPGQEPRSYAEAGC